MSAQELFNIIQNYIFEEKKRINNRREKMATESEYLLGRWADLVTLEHILDTLDPKIFPDLGEDKE